MTDLLHFALPALLATLMGFVMGFLGSGGSILTVPTLVYVLHFDPKEAIPLSLVIVGLTAVIGFVQRYRQGMVNLWAGAFFGVTGMLGTFTGTRLAIYLDGREQMLLFATVMVTAAVFMLQRGLANRTTPASGTKGDISYPLAVVLGAIVGLLTGIVGVGGGFLIVPALTSVGLPVSTAMGTSLFIIAINCATGLIGYAGTVAISWQVAALFLFFSASASAIGARLAKNIDGRRLSIAFALFLFILGVAILLQNRKVFV